LAGTIMLAALLPLLALPGCSTPLDTVQHPPLDVSGDYRSAAQVGALGTLELLLQPSQYVDRFVATLLAPDDPAQGELEGSASIGNAHLVISFQDGKRAPNYYFFFEGVVTTENGAITRIDGQFIFPDQAGNLAATFLPR
jgi:hypothetical protein